jgi:hypothetical protein
VHLLHYIAAMDLYSSFASPDFCRNLFIEHSRHHKPHDLPLSRSQRLIPPTQFVDLGLLFSLRTVTLESLLNRV